MSNTDYKGACACIAVLCSEVDGGTPMVCSACSVQGRVWDRGQRAKNRGQRDREGKEKGGRTGKEGGGDLVTRSAELVPGNFLLVSSSCALSEAVNLKSFGGRRGKVTGLGCWTRWRW